MQATCYVCYGRFEAPGSGVDKCWNCQMKQLNEKVETLVWAVEDLTAQLRSNSTQVVNVAKLILERLDDNQPR